MTRRATIQAIDAQAEALELWVAKNTYREIAEALGCSVSTAHQRVGAALESLRPHCGAEEYRTAQIAELEVARHVLGSFIIDVELDARDRVGAIAELLRLHSHETKLLGLDRAPSAFDRFAQMSDEELDALLNGADAVAAGCSY